jgi:hypothetical protein
VASPHVGDDVPARAVRRGQFERRGGQIVAAGAGQDVRARQGLAAAERGHGVQRQAHLRLAEAVAPDDVRPQLLGCLRPVGDLRGQRVDSQPRLAIEVGPLVCVHEATRLLVEGQRGAPGQDVAQAVEQLDRDGTAAQVLERGGAHQPQFVAPGPAVAERETEAVVDLLEDEPVAEHVLVQVALDPRVLSRVRGERFPHDRCTARAPHAQQRDRAGVVVAVVQPVHRLVGEERAVRVPPACGQTPAGRDEHPEVRVARDAHQEWAHPIVRRDPVVRLSIQRHEPAGGPAHIGGAHGHGAAAGPGTGPRRR